MLLRNLTTIGVGIVILGFFLIFLVCGQGNETSEGGYITPVDLSAISQAVYWQGYFGEVIVSGTGTSNTAVAKGGNLTELNLYFTSNCSVASLSGEIYTTTASSVQWSSIVAGTTAQVDSYLGLNSSDPESGTNTFTINLNYNVSGNLINAPATYTFVNSSPSNVFDTGVLNDTISLVYVTSVQTDQVGFESNTHDFQLIVPVLLSSTPTYYFSAELDIACAPVDFTLNSSDIIFSDNSPTAGDNIVITATIHNTENGSYSNFDVSLLVDNVTQSTNQLSISGNSTNTTQFSWMAVVGTHDITIRVDPSDNVVETNESNNNASKQITVSSPSPPPPGDKYMSIYTEGNCVGELILITVIDEDNNPVSGADIDIFFNGSKIEDLSTNTGGETSFVPAEEGVYTIYASKSGYYDEQKNLNVIVCETCLDGIKNQDETDVDCGGSCPLCDDGKNCSVDSDCINGWCYNGTCKTSTCNDAIKGPGEGGIDCGGPCPPCESCNDSIKNQDETDTDCGGSICSKCADGKNCSVDSDCIIGWCFLGVCTSPSCFDGVQNQNETSIDCGGLCPPCTDGEPCLVDSDCISGWCYNGTCMVPTCFDGVQNQNETGIDCGGPCLACHCFNGVQDGDEIGIDCGGSCPLCGCFNEVKNGNETDVDCGGGCPPCSDGKYCLVDSDCMRGWCYNGTCKIPTCDDGIKGPGEEGIDCGGPCLPCHCFDGILNNDEGGIDCGGECPPCRLIRIITNETETGEMITYVYNATSLCLNNKTDKGETDVDCGGHCPPCESEMKCLDNEDCLSGFCYEGICRLSTCSDGIKGPKEEKIDCGGPCRGCSYIKVESKCYLGENLTIILINPWTGLILIIKDPNGKTTEYNITQVGLKPYTVIHYTPKGVGLHLLELVDYDRRYVNVKKKPLIPILEEIPEEIKSLFVPLIIITLSIIWWRRRRTKVVVDESAIHKFVKEDLLYWELIKKYKRVYTAAEIEKERLKIKELIFIELSESELDQAEDLSDRYGILLDEAKSLVLCKKLRAKKFITGVEFPEEIEDKFEGTKIITVEAEFRLMGL